MDDMLCLYICGPYRLVRKIEGPVWTNIYQGERIKGERIKVGNWSKPERYHWIGPLFLGVWNDDC